MINLITYENHIKFINAVTKSASPSLRSLNLMEKKIQACRKMLESLYGYANKKPTGLVHNQVATLAISLETQLYNAMRGQNI